MMKKEVVGTILVLITAFISGFAIFANKIFVAKIDPLVFTALRAIIIGATFLILSLAINKWSFKNFNKVSWKYLLSIGIIGGGMAFWMFFSGLQLTTGGRAGFIHKTLPIYVTILAFVFLKEKITKKQLIALVVMLAGLIILLSTSITPQELWSNPQLGDLLILGATILWGIENVIARKAMIKGESNFLVSFSRMFFGAIFLFGVILLTNKLSIIASLSPTQWLFITTSTIILFGYVLTYYWGLKYINVSKAATILILSPVITLLLGIIFLGEPAPIIQLIGSALILIGAYFIVTIKVNFLEYKFQRFTKLLCLK